MIRFIMFLLILFAVQTQAQTVYVPGWDEVRVAGTSDDTLSAFGDLPVVITNDTTGGGTPYLTVRTAHVNYTIVPAWKRIHGSQIFNPDGSYSGHTNLIIEFTSASVLNNLTQDLSATWDGFKIFSSPDMLAAFHSDGTLWVYMSKPGEDIKFISNTPQNYDVGGGEFPSGGYPVQYSGEHSKGEDLRKRNWLVISDDQDDINTRGGFGVYTRPAYKYEIDVNGAVQHDYGKDYWSCFERGTSTTTATLKADDGAIKSQSSFIVSIFPNKNRDESLAETRAQFLFPSGYAQSSTVMPNPFTNEPRQHDYSFPNTNEIDAWGNAALTPQTSAHLSDTAGFYYWDPMLPGLPNNELPINMTILFEDIWEFAAENPAGNPPGVVSTRGSSSLPKQHAYAIPYSAPDLSLYSPGPTYDSNANNSSLVSAIDALDVFSEVLLYVSALNDYAQIDRDPNNPLTETEYCNAFVSEIERLANTYTKISGIYIDTLPLDGEIGRLEPMILCYRIMRELKRRPVTKNLKIYLHSSENPIGMQRLFTTELNTNSYNTYAQFELYAPFIDRYADIIVRGEGYPMTIALDANSTGGVKPYISKHIKYVVDPVGKSNAQGNLIWTKTRKDGSAPNENFDDARDLYVLNSLPVSTGVSRADPDYLFNSSTATLTNDELKMNRLVIANAILDNYFMRGHLILESRSNQGDYVTSPSYSRPFKRVDAGPHDGSTSDTYGPFGHYKDYYRSTPIAWKAGRLVADPSGAPNELPQITGFTQDPDPIVLGGSGTVTCEVTNQVRLTDLIYEWTEIEKAGDVTHDAGTEPYERDVSYGTGSFVAPVLKLSCTVKNLFGESISTPYTVIFNGPTPKTFPFGLGDNYPNPFNPTTVINYSIPRAEKVELTIYDILGKRVATLVNEEQEAGSYSLDVDATKWASGTYFYVLKAGENIARRKMLVVK